MMVDHLNLLHIEDLHEEMENSTKFYHELFRGYLIFEHQVE